MFRLLLVVMWVLVGWRQDTPREVISLENVDRIEQLEQIGYGTVQQLDWSADSNQLAVITTVGVVIYDDNGVDVTEPAATLWETEGRILDTNFTNGQTTIAVHRADDSIFIRGVENGQIVEIPDNSGNGFIADESFSSDGMLFSTLRMQLYSHGEVEQTTLSVWDTQTGEQIQQWSGEDYAGVAEIEFLPDSRMLAITNNGVIQLWDVDTGEQNDLLGEGIYLFSLNAEGTKLATYQPAGENQFAVWDITTAELEVGIAEEFANPFFVMAYSPNGEWIASLSANTIQIWSTRTGDISVEIPYTARDYRLLRLSFSSDSRYLAFSDSNDVVYIYDTATGDKVNILEGFSHLMDAVAFNPDGTLLTMSGMSNTVSIWDVQSMTSEQVLTTSDYEITDLAFSVDGTTFFMASPQSGINIRSTADWAGSALSNLEDAYGASDITTSPDGNFLASASLRNFVLRETTMYEEVYSWTLDLEQYFETIAFSADGTKVAIVINEYVMHSLPQAKFLTVIDSFSGTQLHSVEFAVNLPILTSVVYSPDSTLIVTGDTSGVITLWDAANLTQIVTLTEHFDAINSLLFNHDGNLLISGSYDHTIRLWDVAARAEVRTLQGHTNWITDLALSTDGTLLASASQDGTVRLWGVR